MEEDRRKQSVQSSDEAKFCEHDCWVLILIIVSFFQENKSYGVETICIDPLSTCFWTSRREQVQSQQKLQKPAIFSYY